MPLVILSPTVLQVKVLWDPTGVKWHTSAGGLTKYCLISCWHSYHQASIHHHQALYEGMCQAYTEVNWQTTLIFQNYVFKHLVYILYPDKLLRSLMVSICPVSQIRSVYECTFAYFHHWNVSHAWLQWLMKIHNNDNHHHQVHSTSKKLLYQLDHLVQLTNQSPNESPQKKHVSQKHQAAQFHSF